MRINKSCIISALLTLYNLSLYQTWSLQNTALQMMERSQEWWFSATCRKGGNQISIEILMR
jgi:hypothetical protein